MNEKEDSVLKVETADPEDANKFSMKKIHKTGIELTELLSMTGLRLIYDVFCKCVKNSPKFWPKSIILIFVSSSGNTHACPSYETKQRVENLKGRNFFCPQKNILKQV